MVTARTILSAIRAALEAMEPDGRYALDGETFAPTWLVAPDEDDIFESMRDLLCQPLLGGPLVVGQSMVYPLSVAIVGAAYKGERTSYLSSTPMTAMERMHGMGMHVLETIYTLPIHGCMIQPLGYEMPTRSDPPDFLTTDALFTVITT